MRSVDPTVIDESVVVAASSRAVWNALAGPGQPAWWPGMEIDASPDGRFVESWLDDDGTERTTRGSVVVAEPPRRLVLTWRDADWPAETLVSITIEPSADGGSQLRVVHEGWCGLPDGDGLAEAHRVGWRYHLGNWAAATTASRTAPGTVQDG